MSFRLDSPGFPFALLVLAGACVPTGNAPAYDAGAPAPSASVKPSLNVMTTPFEDTFDRPDAASDALAGLDASFGLATTDAAPEKKAVEAGGFLLEAGAETGVDAGEAADAGERRVPGNLGPNWTATRPSAWRIEKGWLCAQDAKNHGIWLNRTLPVNARIEYDAIAYTEDGDLKAELWGDGRSFATGTSYTNATSYLAILGGWKNTIHALARLNEHGSDRKEIHVDKDSDDPRQRSVVRGQLYQFKVERTDGKTIKVFVNGVEYFSWADPAPLTGSGHDHLGFNEWEAKVCFDNVKVTPLP